MPEHNNKRTKGTSAKDENLAQQTTMTFFIRFACVVAAILSTHAAGQAPPVANLLLNGGFEDSAAATITRSSSLGMISTGIAGWRAFSNGTNAATFEVVSNPAAASEGKNYLTVTSMNEPGKDAGIDTDYAGAGMAAVTAGVNYAVSFDLQHVSGENSVIFSVRTFEGTSTKIAETFYPGLLLTGVPTGSWKHFSYEFKPTVNGTLQVVFRPKAGEDVQTETFLLDNVRVAPEAIQKDVTREFVISKRYLNMPIANGDPNPNQSVTVFIDGKAVRTLQLDLANADPDWWAVMDVSPWKGKKITLVCDRLPEGSKALRSIEQSDEIKGGENLYDEALRPQFHFSAKRGHINDPNGLVFYKGELGWTPFSNQQKLK